MSSAILYSIPAAAPRGLDAKRFVVSTVVERADRKPLTEADCAAIEKVYAAELAAQEPEASAPSAVAKPRLARPASKTKRAARVGR